MALSTRCPDCGKSVTVREESVGKRVRCPACSSVFQVDSVDFQDADTVGEAEEAAMTEAGPAGESCQTEPAGTLGTLGRFELREVVGRGGFGTVYRALDPVLCREVALKVPRSAPGDGQASRILPEAKAAARLRHPNIVAVFDAVTDGAAGYIASEYVRGEPLSSVIHRREEAGLSSDCREAAQWVRDLARALHYAHGEGIIHRDVKPHNVMMSVVDEKPNRPQLTDFGLARQVETDTTVTSENTLLGTPAYMPPEQARGEVDKIGPWSDQYSLGVVLYQLLTGQTPFEGSTQQVLMDVIQTPPRALRAVRPDVPQPLEAICLKAIRKDPADRYADCQEMADDLDRFLDDELVHAMRHTIVGLIAHWSRKHPTVAGWTAAAVLALLLFTGATVTIGLGSWSQARLATRRAADEAAAAETKAQEAIQKLENAAAARAQAEKEVQGTDGLRAESEMATYARQIDKTLRAYQDDDLLLADELVESTRWDHRKFEYSYARRLATGGDRTLIGHTGPVNCLTYSPDGALVASGGDDATVRVWDSTSGECLHVFRGHTKSVVSVAFSPDGKSIVSVTDTCARPSGGHPAAAPAEVPAPTPAPVPAPAPAPAPAPPAPRADPSARNGSSKPSETGSAWPPVRLASFQQPDSPTTEIKVWQARTGVEAAAIQNPQACRAVFHAWGKHAITLDRDGHIRSWTLETGQASGLDLDANPHDTDADAALTAAVSILTLAGDGQRMFSMAANSQQSSTSVATLWSLPLKRKVCLFAGKPDKYSAAALSSTGTRLALASASSESQIELWAVPAGVESPSLVTDPPEKQPAAQAGAIKCPPGQLSTLVFSPDEKLLAFAVVGRPANGCGEKSTPSISIHCAWSGAELWRYKGHEGRISELAFRPDSQQLASAGQDGTVKLWDATTGPESRTLFARTAESWGATTCLAFSPDSRYLAVTAMLTRAEEATPEAAPAPAPTPAPAPVPRAGLNVPRDTLAASSPIKTPLMLASFDQPAETEIPPEPWQSQHSLEGSLVVVDARSGEKFQALAGHEGPVYSAAFRPDGEQLASAGDDGKVIVWDWKNGKSLQTIEAHARPVLAVAYSPDGKIIASASCEVLSRPEDAPAADPVQEVSLARGEIKLWDPESSKLLRTLEGHTDEILSIAFSPDGKRIASASADRSVKVWNAETGDELLQLEDPHGIAIRLAFDPTDGSRIAAAVNNPCFIQQPGEVLVWDGDSGALVRRFGGHKGFVTSVAFSADGKRIASGASSAMASPPLWAEGVIPQNAKTGVCKPACCAPACEPECLAAGCSAPAEVIVWHAATGTEMLRLEADDACRWKPVYKSLEVFAQYTENNTPHSRPFLFTVTKQVAVPQVPVVTSVAISPDATLIAAGGPDSVRIWNAWICQPVHTKKWPASMKEINVRFDGKIPSLCEPLCAFEGTSVFPLQSLAYSPRGDLLAVGGLAGNSCESGNPSIVRIYDAVTGVEILSVPIRRPAISDLSFSHDGARLACVSGHQAQDGFTGTLELWNIPAGTPAWTPLGHEATVTRAAFSPDGTLLAIGGRDRTVTLWNSAGGEQVRLIKDLSAPVCSLAFSRDGKLLAAGTGQFDPRSGTVMLPGDVTVWEVATGKPVKTVPSQGGGFIDVDFHPAKPNLLVSVHSQNLGPQAQGWCQLWDIETGQMVYSAVCGQGAVNSFGFHTSGQIGAALGQDFDLPLWGSDRQTRLLGLTGHRDTVLSFAWNPTAEQVATASTDGRVKIWDTATALRRAPDCGCCPALEQVRIAPAKDGAIRYRYQVSRLVPEQLVKTVSYTVSKTLENGEVVCEERQKDVPYVVWKPVFQTRETLIAVETATVFRIDGTRVAPAEIASLFKQERSARVAYQDDVLDPLCLRRLPPESIVLVVPVPRAVRLEPAPAPRSPATCAPMPQPPGFPPAPPALVPMPAAPPSPQRLESAPAPRA